MLFRKTRRGFEKIIDVIGEILAFFTILLMIFMLINGRFNFLPEDVTEFLTYFMFVAIIFTVGLKSLEFALNNSLILTIIMLVLLTIAVIFVFIPDTLPNWITNHIPAPPMPDLPGNPLPDLPDLPFP